MCLCAEKNLDLEYFSKIRKRVNGEPFWTSFFGENVDANRIPFSESDSPETFYKVG